MQQAHGRDLEVPCGVTAQHALTRCKSPLPSHRRGCTGRCGGSCPAGVTGVRMRQGQLCCCVHGCACLSACRKHGQCFYYVKLCKAGYLDRSGQSCACIHVRGLLVVRMYVSISVRSPHCVQHAPKGSSCPILHIIGLTGLFSGARSANGRDCLDMMSSWPASNLTQPWEGNHKPRRGLINKTFSLQEGKENM